MSKYTLHVNLEKQSWCLNRPDGKRFIGRWLPFTDPQFSKVLDESMGVYAGWLKMALRDEGITDGEPLLLDANDSGFKIVPPEHVIRINRILQELVATHCSSSATNSVTIN